MQVRLTAPDKWPQNSKCDLLKPSVLTLWPSWGNSRGSCDPFSKLYRTPYQDQLIWSQSLWYPFMSMVTTSLVRSHLGAATATASLETSLPTSPCYQNTVNQTQFLVSSLLWSLLWHKHSQLKFIYTYLRVGGWRVGISVVHPSTGGNRETGLGN